MKGIGLVCTGLFAGFLTAVLVLEVSLRRFDGTVYTQVRLVELADLDKLAVVTLLPALAATGVLVLLRRRAATRWPVVVAFLLLALVMGLTVVVNLPINAEQVGWNAGSPPAGWAEVRDRWQLAHTVRTLAAVVAFVLLALGRPGQPVNAQGPRRPHATNTASPR
ncbi:DUF1772 domain-containing protein [Actinoplanes sp. NPDC026670]|uniref:DUF1772 domain-containing protein n=1 Tax=Actinoplanes sp. NPDC026670 TaxID=3154700 RepID=UPI0033F77292